jgi:hypothetical protein
MKRKFYTGVVVTIIAATVFIITNFTPYFRGNKLADFMQGFSGGLAAGALLITLGRGVQWKREKDAQTSL